MQLFVVTVGAKFYLLQALMIVNHKVNSPICFAHGWACKNWGWPPQWWWFLVLVTGCNGNGGTLNVIGNYIS